MATYKLEWVEKKGEDWVLASLESGEKDVSINRTSKKGEVFPNFDTLTPGMSVEGELWQSGAGKWYLFPPRPETNATGANRGQGGAFKQKMIEDSMNKKNESITRFQGQKEESIKQMSAQRDAVLIVTTFYKDRIGNDPILEGEMDSIIKKKITEYRDWFLSHEFGETLPF